MRERGTRSWSIGPLVVVVALGASCTTGTRADRGHPEAVPPAVTWEETPEGYSVDVDPAGFEDTIDNPYMPFTPGSTWRLEGVTDEGREVDTITVLDRTREVMGVATTVVKDVVRLDGELAEKTWDWFAQDRQSNVWYFGEDTAEYEDGKVVSRSGAWEAGVDGALPGIVMPAEPTVSDATRQEFYPGEAEDMGWIVQTDITKEVPFGSFDDAIRILEWSPLEPRIVVQKFYAPGVGLLGEKALSGALEDFQLVEHTAAD